MVALAVLSSALMLGEAAGALSPDILYFAPLLLLGLPLLGGRYVGEAAITRMAATRRPVRRRASTRVAEPAARRFVRLLPRGGRLVASSLAVRPPPLLASR